VNGITNLSISHKWASLNDLECARIDDLKDALRAMRSADGVRECAIVQTLQPDRALPRRQQRV